MARPPFERIVFGLIGMPERDLTVRQMAVMILCGEALDSNDTRIRILAGNLGINKPAISRAAGSLVKYGHVMRVRSEVDRRDVYLTITEKGRGFLAAAGALGGEDEKGI